MRDRIGERFQLPVQSLEVDRLLFERLVELANLFLASLSFSYFPLKLVSRLA
jgi:hypothetical protein